MSRNRTFGRAATSATTDPSSGRDIATDLTKERNRLAADRTLMPWIRTSLSLMGFGFGIGKAYEYLTSAGLRDPADPVRSTLIFGTSFISLGMLALVAAV